MSEMPLWKVPKDLDAVLEDGDGMWEDERWSPIQLTAMSGTEFDGREIPVAWQVEFDPFDEEFERVNAQVNESGTEPNGYGWGEHVQKVIHASDPALAKRLNLGDCEAATCVIWVETEQDARTLVQTIWKLINE
jgi:hypothetical protein